MIFLKRLKLSLVFLGLLVVASCRWFEPTVYFFITNSSEDKPSIPMVVIIGSDTIFNNVINYINEIPSFKYTPEISVSKGKYLIRVFADSGKVISEKVINIDGDRWVFIDYSYKMPPDSSKANLIRNAFKFEPFVRNWFLQGKPQKVKIWTMNREPRHM